MYSVSILLTALLTFPSLRVHAYLDPGSGSFILQILLATLLGGLFIFRSYLGKAKNFVVRLFNKRDDEQE